MKRTPMKPGTKQLTRRQSLQASSSLSRSPVKRREVALRQRSKKRASEQVWYSALRFAFLRIDGDQRRCERCAEPATEVHHMRGRTGADYLDVSLWAALCHDCHAWVTEHPREAIAAGLSLPRTHRRTA